MRLDLYLKLSRLVLRRNLAQEMISAGLVLLNESQAKSGRSVKAGDIIAIKSAARTKVVRVLVVPAKKQVSKAEALSLYETVSDEATETGFPF